LSAAREPERDPYSLDEVKAQLVVLGRERGFVTSGDLFESLPEITPDQVEDVLAQITDHLNTEGIEIIELPGDDTDAVTQIRIEVDALKAPTNDPVRMYLKEIGKVPLLNAPQEVDLARRIEAGELCTELQEQIVTEGKPDPKRFRLATTRVWEIWDHQMTAFGKVEGIGRDPLAQKKAYRPKTDEDVVSYLHRVERDGQLAKRKLIEANLRLVVSIAKRYVGRGMLFLDLIQEGNLGLIRAVEKFDYTKGFKFSTYATWWIRQAITRGMADQARTIRLPVHLVEQVNKLARIRRDLHQKLGRDATTEELAAESGIAEERIADLLDHARDPVSLDMPVGSDEEAPLGDFIEDGESADAETTVISHLLHEDLRRVLATLEDREQQVIRMRYGLDDGQPRTLDQIGRRFGLSRERVRQIEREVMAKLRIGERADRLRAYAS
jgi:RNA polymerase nonessential primary-like sigma factor